MIQFAVGSLGPGSMRIGNWNLVSVRHPRAALAPEPTGKVFLGGEELRHVLAHDLNLVVVMRLKARFAAEAGETSR
jgi:hypothetical protein